jgi:hypothetical protein
LGWLASLGPLVRVGVEGAGSYGAGGARRLAVAGVEVAEVLETGERGYGVVEYSIHPPWPRYRY